MNAPRSGCPINLTLEALGDRWSLIVIRDLMFGNRRHFRELLTPVGGADNLEHSGRPAARLRYGYHVKHKVLEATIVGAPMGSLVNLASRSDDRARFVRIARTLAKPRCSHTTRP